MAAYQVSAYLFLGIAYAIFFAGIYFALFHQYRWDSKYRARRGYLFMAALILSVIALEVGFVIGKNEDVPAAQKVAEVFSHTFQFFTLDADYTGMIAGGAAAYPLGGVIFFYILSCAYTVIVPMAGGFFLFQLLCAVVPRCTLWFNRKKTKFVFSELNERSISIAEDIARISWELGLFRRRKFDFAKNNIDFKEEPWLKSVCIIFTDVYSDDQSETRSELLMRAKRIGAICLKDDILERPFHWVRTAKNKKVVYFMMSISEEENLTQSVSLLTEKRGLWMSLSKKPPYLFKTENMEMFVFVQSEGAGALIDVARKKFCKKNTVKVINEFRNVVYRMMDDSELMDRLIFGGLKEDEQTMEELSPFYRVWKNYITKDINGRSLRLVVFGSGRIAKECIKTVIWCWQMLSSLRKEPRKDAQGNALTEKSYSCEKIEIIVLSQNANRFKQELFFELPDIISQYGTIAFYEVSFNTEEFCKKFHNSGAANAQRVLIAFGDDEMNLQAAQWAERELINSRAHLESPSPVIIDYAVENDGLYEMMDRGKGALQRTPWCIVRPFSTMKECFSYSSIRMDALERRALQAERTHYNQTVSGFLSSYNRDSSVAVALHFPYKLFCLDPNQGEKTQSEYFFKIMGKDNTKSCKDQLYWLEHHRWCAYMRTRGFRCPTAKQFATMAFDVGNRFLAGRHKSNERMLHACLFESSPDYCSTEQLLLAYATARYPDDPNRLGDILQYVRTIRRTRADALCMRKRSGDCLAERNEAFDGIRALMEAECKALQKEIALLRSKESEDLPLSDWLGGLFPEIQADALDKLSLVVTLCIGKSYGGEERYADFKRYDIDMTRNLYVQLLQMRLERYFNALCGREGGFADVKEENIKEAVGQIRRAMESSVFEETGEEVTPDLIIVTHGETEDLFLLRTDAEPRKKQRGKELLVLSRKKRSEMLSVTVDGGRYFLFEVPHGGTRFIGREQDRKYLYLSTADGEPRLVHSSKKIYGKMRRRQK